MTILFKGILSLAAVAVASFSLAANVDAGSSHKRKAQKREYVERDCTPINGRYGYYGNPWCDGGFLTLEEQEMRRAHRLDIPLERRWNRYWW